MHILLISACEKAALRRSRSVLDSFARRVGDRAWATPVTQEGMREIRAALCRVASRQTAVACYVNEGRTAMRLLWIVGARGKFGPQGHFPAGSTRRGGPEGSLPPWLRIVTLLARAAGHAHDFGKGYQRFDDKLAAAVAAAGPPAPDPFRHEWLSGRILAALRREKGSPDPAEAWRRAWKEAFTREKEFSFLDNVSKGREGAATAVDSVVLTHHTLFAGRVPEKGLHVRDDLPAGAADRPSDKPPPLRALAAQRKAEARLVRLAGDKSPLFWRAAGLIARVGMIFADHVVSARWSPAGPGVLHANTGRHPESGRIALNQGLDEHLLAVGREAGTAAGRLCRSPLPGLSEEAVAMILAPSGPGPYYWQDLAAASLARCRQEADDPVLVLNLANLGAGKTRANAKFACALARDGHVRFATALNLRSLTLQTGRAYRRQLGIGGDECATIIGDRVAKRLYERLNRDEAEGYEESGVVATPADAVLPDWLDPWIALHPEQRAILGAPVLVSTIDYLIHAGDPSRQGHHVSAFLRLADSDLILDEIDSYDPRPFVAVLRLIQTAAFLGRNVICSTATLARPMAEAAVQAFRFGSRMRAALRDKPAAGAVALVSDRTACRILAPEQPFVPAYEDFIGELCASPAGLGLRRAVRQPVAEMTESGWLAAVAQGVREMHAANGWLFAETGKRLSIGLVRIANIGTAIRVARHLATVFPQARVGCYHANRLRIERHLLEARLDGLLCRKDGNGPIENDPDIRRMVEEAPGDVMLILVATPVEEVGRDHDFDYAVIEPSSIHSLLQTSGRVNRHRQERRPEPNIAVLDCNARHMRKQKAAFRWPGLESESRPYPSHSMADLLPWPEAGILSLDIALRFAADCGFAVSDDKAMTEALQVWCKRFFTEEQRVAWLGRDNYRKTALREPGRKDVWRLGPEGEHLLRKESRDGIRFEKSEAFVTTVAPVANAWLSWPLEELEAACEGLEGLSRDVLMEVEIAQWGEGKGDIRHDWSFGFCRA